MVSPQSFEHSLVIASPPTAVLDAFFDGDALAVWWRARRSLCVARPMGSYAIEWEPGEPRDEILGRRGGALHATVIDVRPGVDLFLAETYWLPPDGPPIGPMAIEVTCRARATGTLLRVRQSGWDDSSPRWSRYYEVASAEWIDALGRLRTYLESRTSPAIPLGP